MKKRTRNLILSFIVPILVLIIQPFGLTLSQSVILSSLILTLSLWVNKAFDKTLVSIFLLAIFLTFGNTPYERVLFFPLSNDFWLIILSFLFSQGIVNSKLANKLFKPYIGFFATTPLKLMLTTIVLALIMIAAIPQPFSRLIIISMIFREYFLSMDIKEDLRKILSFSVIMIIFIVNGTVLKGDIIFNRALVNIAESGITELEWMKYMTVPTLVFLTVTVSAFLLRFKNELRGYNPVKEGKPDISMTMDDKINLGILVVTLILWATEGLHPIGGVYIILLGTLLMLFKGLISFKDIKYIEWRLLIFLTATFSIGATMSGSGTAGVLFGKLEPVFPNEMGLSLILAIVLSTMLIHMVLGSLVTTTSVVIPGLFILTKGTIPLEIMMFLVYISIFSHYLLPFHSVGLVVGEGSKFFDDRIVFKFGLVMTIITVLSPLLIYLPWWKLVGIL